MDSAPAQHEKDAILCSPIQMMCALNILKLPNKVTSPLASFYPRPINSLPYGRMFVIKMLGQGNAFTKNKLNLPECQKTNNIGFAATDLQNLAIPDLRTNLVTSTTAARPVQSCTPCYCLTCSTSSFHCNDIFNHIEEFSTQPPLPRECAPPSQNGGMKSQFATNCAPPSPSNPSITSQEPDPCQCPTFCANHQIS